jgi:hypothetical protein
VNDLTAADELYHAGPTDLVPNWQENFFFVLWNTTTHDGLLIHLQRSPYKGWQEALIGISIGGHFGSAAVRRPFDPNASVPEVEMTCIEPYKRWRIKADFRGAEGAGPLGFLFTELEGTGVPCAVDLVLEASLPATDFNAALHDMVNRLQERPTGSQMGQQNHYEQGGTWSGSMRIGDRVTETNGLFVRDHSWGIRNETAGFTAFWTASCLDDGNLFCNAIGITSGDKIVGAGLMTDKNGTRLTTDVRARFDPEPGILSYNKVQVQYGAGVDAVLDATVQAHMPKYLPHSGPLRYDNNGLSAVTIGKHQGFGVMEWATVMTAEQAAEVDPNNLASMELNPT